MVKCPHCNGNGEVDTFDLYEVIDGRIKCPTCDGVGKIPFVERCSSGRSTSSDRRENICNRP